MSKAMISRVADSIYWMTRYIERAENVARFVDVNQYLTLDLPMAVEKQWVPMLEVSGDKSAYEARYEKLDRDGVIRFLAFDTENPNSIVSCLRSARENARSVREVISTELWRQVNKMFHYVRAASEDRDIYEDPHVFLDNVKEACHQVTGITEATMAHDEAWHFARLGRMLERADKTSRILDVKYFLLLPGLDYVGTPYDKIQWAAVLKSASALEMYRKKFQGIMPRQVVRFLIFDALFPRSIKYCLKTALESLHAISGSQMATYSNSAERLLGRLCADIDFADIDEVFEIGMHQYLDGMQIRLNEIGNAIFDTYFSLSIGNVTNIAVGEA